MPSFVYKAKNANAKTVSGHIQAEHQNEALETIYQQGLVPVTIEEETPGGVLVSQIKRRRVNTREVYLFTKQLAGLVKSSVPLLKGLEVIAAQQRDQYLASVIANIADGVRAGRSFSSCLADYPHIFSSVYVAMVRAGEEMGHLREVLMNLAQFQKRQDELSSKVKSSMVYPLVMLVVGAGTVVFILTFVLPKIAVIFADARQQLPLPTRIVMAVSSFVAIYWTVAVAAIAGVMLFFGRWRQTSAGNTVLGRWALMVPVLKEFVVKVDLERFCRTSSMLLHSGLSLLRTIEIAAQTTSNPHIRLELLSTAEALSAGESFGTALSRCRFLPFMFVETLTVAEEGGHLKDALIDIADAYETDVTEMLKTMTTLLEPLMILTVGAVVGFIIFAMLLPIFSMDIMAR